MSVVHQGYDKKGTTLSEEIRHEVMKYHIDRWNEIRIQFEMMFNGLGTVETSENLLSYSSVEPSVATGIALLRNGSLTANMPLHNLDSTFDTVKFNESITALTLIGDSLNYTYRIPNEILARREKP